LKANDAIEKVIFACFGEDIYESYRSHLREAKGE
jgi:hypothetical protein